jgi:hypothetical protein
LTISLRALALALGLVLGCAADAPGIDVPDENEPAAAGADGAAGVSSAPPEAAPTPAALPPPLFGDEGALPQKEPDQPQRCRKVDFLYVVDNSASMVDEQENLARSFVGFSRVVQQTLGDIDRQIMVVDTDDTNVTDIVSETGNMCDGRLGAGTRMSWQGQSCGMPAGERFMRNDQANLEDTFSCLAKVGTLGNVDERPIDALLRATGATVSDLDEECNAGFLRDDALLVITIITDEEDEKSKGDPESWKRALLAAKNGNERALVVLGLLGDTKVPGGLPGGPCDELYATDSPRLRHFVEGFELGSLGSVCADDYSTFFAQAVSTIDTACAEFEPMLH